MSSQAGPGAGHVLCCAVPCCRYDAVRVVAMVLMLPPPATAPPSTHPAAAPAGSSGTKGGTKRSSSSQPSTLKVVKLLIWDDKHPAAKAAAAAAEADAAAAKAAAEAAAGAAGPAAGAAPAGAAPPPAAAVPGGVPASAHSRDAADAAARAAAKQLHQLPSLALVDDPVCVCPPGRDWDGLLGTLSLNGALDWTRGTTAAGRARGVAGREMQSGALQAGQDAAAAAQHQQQQGSHEQHTLMQQPHRSPVKSGCSGAEQHTPPSAGGAAAAGSSGASDQPGCSCGAVPVQLQYYASELSLLQGFCALIQALDPDVIVGWDIQQGGLGYLSERGLQLGFNVLRSASKTPEVSGHRQGLTVSRPPQHPCDPVLTQAAHPSPATDTCWFVACWLAAPWLSRTFMYIQACLPSGSVANNMYSN